MYFFPNVQFLRGSYERSWEKVYSCDEENWVPTNDGCFFVVNRIS